jgi:hypothetical protein
VLLFKDQQAEINSQRSTTTRPARPTWASLPQIAQAQVKLGVLPRMESDTSQMTDGGDVWDGDDVWILQAIADSHRPRSLERVIGSADYINVNIPSRNILVWAVNRLVAAGLVTAEGEKLGVTRDGKRLVRRAHKGRRAREVHAVLLAVLLEEVPPPLPAETWNLSESDWQAGYDRYYPPEKRAGRPE